MPCEPTINARKRIIAIALEGLRAWRHRLLPGELFTARWSR